MKKYIILVFINFYIIVFSQTINEIGMPYIEKFKYDDMKNFSHIWQIAEAPNHLMYFVNDNGLLQYDGENWEIFKGNKAIHRSLLYIIMKLFLQDLIMILESGKKTNTINLNTKVYIHF